MNGELSYSLSGRGWAVGALAAPSLDEFDISEHSKYTSIKLQIEGLESVAVITPMSRFKMPLKACGEPVRTTTVDKNAPQLEAFTSGCSAAFLAAAARMATASIVVAALIRGTGDVLLILDAASAVRTWAKRSGEPTHRTSGAPATRSTG